jgi:polyphosphate kinase
MNRNMFRRVETCFPIDSKKLHDRILHDLDCYLKDNSQTWLLQSDGTYLQAKPKKGEETYVVQNELLKSFQ